MKHIKILGLALMAVLALGGISASGASAALTFLATPVGGVIDDHNLNVHKFKTAVGTVECQKALSHGTVTAEHSLTNLEDVEYLECKVTAPFEASATVSLALYVFDANGEVEIENTITVKSSLCTITVKPQRDTGITYLNLPGEELEISTNVHNIVYSTSGFCGTKNNEKGGIYEGKSLASVLGGTLLVN